MSLTNEQRALRLTGIGGSEIGAVAGLSPFATAIDVYLAKVEGREPETNSAMRRGIHLEPAVVSWYQELTGAEVREVGTVRGSNPLVIATPDRIAKKSDEYVLEIKTSGFRSAGYFGEEGTDQVPLHYLAQVQWTMLATSLSHADLAVLIGGDELKIYPITADKEFQELLVSAAERFWTDYVLTKTPPPPDGSETSGKYLKSKYRDYTTGMLVQATPHIEAKAREFLVAQKMVQDAAKQKELLQQELEKLVGDTGAEGVLLSDGKITWKTTASSVAVDLKRLVADPDCPPELVQRYTHTKPGVRRFLVNVKGQK